MKKFILAITLVAAVTYAADKTFSLAAGTASETITNSTKSQTWYLKGVYGLMSGAAAETVSIKKVSGGVDVVLGSQSMTTNATDVNVSIPLASVLYLSPGEALKVVRVDTNGTFKGFVSTSPVEGATVNTSVTVETGS